MQKSSSLIIDIRPGESLSVSGITVELVQKSGRLARLRVTAPRDMKIEKKDADAKNLAPSMTN